MKEQRTLPKTIDVSRQELMDLLLDLIGAQAIESGMFFDSPLCKRWV